MAVVYRENASPVKRISRYSLLRRFPDMLIPVGIGADAGYGIIRARRSVWTHVRG
jgi:hypothetical protein